MYPPDDRAWLTYAREFVGDRFAHHRVDQCDVGRAGRGRRSLGDRGLGSVLVPPLPRLGIGTAGPC